MRVVLMLLAAFAALTACAGEGATIDRPVVERLIRDQLDSWALEDEELFLSTIHQDLVFAYPGKRLDAESALALFRYWADNYSETKVYFHNIIIEGDRFSVEYQFATTRDRDGARSAAGTVTTGQVKDGKLMLWKEYLDGRVSKLQMEGELNLDEGAEPFPWPE